MYLSIVLPLAIRFPSVDNRVWDWLALEIYHTTFDIHVIALSFGRYGVAILN